MFWRAVGEATAGALAWMEFTGASFFRTSALDGVYYRRILLPDEALDGVYYRRILLPDEALDGVYYRRILLPNDPALDRVHWRVLDWSNGRVRRGKERLKKKFVTSQSPRTSCATPFLFTAKVLDFRDPHFPRPVFVGLGGGVRVLVPGGLRAVRLDRGFNRLQ